MDPRRTLWLLLGVVGLAGAVAGVLVPDGPVAEGPVLNAVIAWTFILSGLIARARHPENRIGVLIALFGIARGVGPLLAQLAAKADAPVLLTIAILTIDWAILVFVAVLLAFPDGRLRTRVDLAIFAVVGFAVVPAELAWLLFLPAEEGAPANALSLFPDAAI